jgi:outer membrane immunogenic protein
MRLKSLAAASAAALAFAPVAAFASGWSGVYIGGNAGYDWGSSDTSVALSGFYTGFAPAIRTELTGLYAQELDPNGKSLGAQIGVNHQFGGGFVLGLEADYANLGAKDDVRKGPTNLTSAPGNIYITRGGVDGKHMLAAKAKIGFSSPNWLFYAAGGWAMARVEGATEISNNNNYLRLGSDTEWLSGLVYGAGIETKVGGAWSLRVEYLRGDFADFEYQNGFQANSAFIGFPFVETVTQDFDLNIVRLGVNFSF